MSNVTRWLFSFFLGSYLIGAEALPIESITVTGLIHLQKDTVESYIPIQKGKTVTDDVIEKTIKALYATQFFEHVQLYQKNRTLIVSVKERPIIRHIEIIGNSALPKDKLEEILKVLRLQKGQFYQAAAVVQLQANLVQAYHNQGKYNVSIIPQLTPKDNNTLDVVIQVNEGATAKIKKIEFVGNHAFTSRKLIGELDETTSAIFGFFSGKNKFSYDLMEHDVGVLTRFYQDHGYAHFRVKEHTFDISPDQKTVTIHFVVDEGALFHFSGFALHGNLLGKEEALQKAVSIVKNKEFSQAVMQESSKQIGLCFGNDGYAFAEVQAIPQIHEATQDVFVDFFVQPGKQVYVRFIDFTGNSKTSDEVLRREMRQYESSLLSVNDIQESVRRLRNLGYLSDVDVSTKTVYGKDNQVDLGVAVKEEPSAQAMFGIGYGTDGFLYNVSLNQQNFLGTGHQVGMSFEHSKYSSSYSMNYLDPYYTMNGISRAFHFYFTRTTPGRLQIVQYMSDDYGLSVNYGIPISDKTEFNVGFGYEDYRLKLGSSPSFEVQDFVNQNGSHFKHGIITLGVSRSDYDQQPLTTKGFGQSLSSEWSVPLGREKLQYYKLNYNAHYFQPLIGDFILSLMGNLGYGSSYGSTHGGLPFFQHYFVGGPESIRGYETFSLGPRDSNGNPIGGNCLVAGSAELIFPNPWSEKVRTSLFLDAGNVYNTRADSVNLHELRYSVGVSAMLHLSFIQGIRLSFAKPIHPRAGDREEYFQFGFGAQL